ncbi:MAG: hypothetical protein CMC70_01830 [Flavobacteriaceae bacterium]|nr:hypothetical protein [Flavobacteriaceae bacterium]
MQIYNQPQIYIFYCLFSFLVGGVCAQVGINTTSPNGILEINTATQGVVLPRIGLESTTDLTSVINPHPTNTTLLNGTVIYNTNTQNDVTPGMYVWITDKWVAQFDNKKQSKLFEQTTLNIRTQSDATYKTIALSSSNFIADYSGLYRIEVNVNFGGGDAKVPNGSSEGDLNIAKMSGNFRLTFGTDIYNIPAHSYSTAYNGATNYFGIWKQFTLVTNVPLTQGENRSVNLAFLQDPAPEFVGNGNNDNPTGQFSGGDGHVGFDIPCTVEIIYIGEQ